MTNDDDWHEHEARWSEAEQRAAPLRGCPDADLRQLAQARGERGLACMDRERRALEKANALPVLSPEWKAAFAAAAAAGTAREEADLDYLAVLIALDPDAAREQIGRLFGLRDIPPGVHRL